MSDQSALRHKIARWRMLLNDALDNYEQVGLADIRAPNAAQMLHAIAYLGGITNIMRKDCQDSSKRISFAMQAHGIHQDTIDANSLRAASQAVDNMYVVSGEVEREVLRQDYRPPRTVISPPPIRQVATPEWEPDSEEEPTDPGTGNPGTRNTVQPRTPPVVFGE